MPEHDSPDIERELVAIDDALAGRPVDPDLTELGALALALREEKPQPSEAFGRRMDNEMARGFHSPRPSRAARWRAALPYYLPAAGAAALLLLIVSLAVLAPGGSDDSGGGGLVDAVQERSGGDSGGDDSGGGAGGDRRSGESAQGTEPAPSSPGVQPPSTPRPQSDRERDRKVQRSAALTLAAPPDEFDRTADEIVRVTDMLGGYVLSSNVSADDRDGGRATFELRVPNRSQQRALSELSRLAHVRERSQSSVDITGSYVSARERVNDARAERQSLLRQLGRADTPNETRSIRERLRIVSRQLSAAKRDLQRVNNRATFSTIGVTLLSDKSAADGDEGAWKPGDAFDDALRILEVSAGVLMIAAAVLLPIALLLVAARMASQRTLRRRRERALEA